jgi:flagellin
LQETNYTLVGSAYTSGVSSISSGTGSTLVISTQTDAAAAIATIDLAVDQVSAARANLGALQARLESAARTIAVATENAAASNSRITDADIAEAMSDLVRTQVLQQAGISMLAQANQSPSLVLQLLR